MSQREKTRYLTRLSDLAGLVGQPMEDLNEIADRFAFRISRYYLGLIDWNDPNDPLRRIVIPSPDELKPWGDLDASNEAEFTVTPGLQHKYQDTALLLVNDVCGAYCRFCFRKRLFLDDNTEVVKDISEPLKYLRQHPEISNVLLTGGDPLVLSVVRLRPIFEQLSAIPHVQIIRIGSKMLAFDPIALKENKALFQLIREFTRRNLRIYIMAHFNHHRELTEPAVDCIEAFRNAGAIVVNQTPIIAGVNDDPMVLTKLLQQLTIAGVRPYYIFQCRPTEGNYGFTVPLEKSYEIFTKAQLGCSGLALTARFVISHTTGKVEVIGLDDSSIYMRYHRAAKERDLGKVLVFRRNESACWLDDYLCARETPAIMSERRPKS
jgi:lysine 2,3-aminomutase